METDTIAAIATAVKDSGISIIRISGVDAVAVADRVFEAKNGRKLTEAKSHMLQYGFVQEGGVLIDEAMAAVMRSPHSYTREDVVEIDCHGGIRVTNRILEAVLHAGARPAEPGEFTKRAFLNGRIDLSQAEAVMDVIRSQNDYALASSVRQLQGGLGRKLQEVRDQILGDVAFIEAALDDPEHIHVEDGVDEIRDHVDEILEKMIRLLKNAENGRMIKEGIQTVILGKPNAGKSSLLNRVAGEEVAIVTDIAGTTRDSLEQAILIGGVQLNIVDTAGIRETDDVVEKIGVSRAKERAEAADLILFLVDGSVPLDENDRAIMEFVRDRMCLVLLNKSDLKQVAGKEELERMSGKRVISISAKEGSGMGELEQAIVELFFQGQLSFNDEIYITNARQKYALEQAVESLRQAKASMEAGMPEDFLTIDLISACESLGEITGDTAREDLADRIFRDFCMGK